jgi:cysteine desulfurase / selenocysteine lyase
MAIESNPERTYLDHAATSWPKPPGVLEAFCRYQTECGVSVGRGSYRASLDAAKLLESARSQVVGLVNARSTSEIAFTANGTHALVAGLLGILRPEDHVVTTAAEHNSVLRPLAQLERDRGVRHTVVPVNEIGMVDPADVRTACQDATRLIVMTHASNVTGAIQPIEEVARFAQQRGIRFFVDAAQTIGYHPVDVTAGIDMLAFPGHKGAGGLLGTGVLYLSQELASEFRAPWVGGTGTDSFQIEGPFGWQASVESGNINMPAIASLDEGIRWGRLHQAEQRAKLAALSARLADRLARSKMLKLIGPVSLENRVPVYSVVSESMAPQELASILDSSFGIEVRAGLHCAGLIHDNLGTKNTGGTLRVSLGHTSTEHDIERFESALADLEQHF